MSAQLCNLLHLCLPGFIIFCIILNPTSIAVSFPFLIDMLWWLMEMIMAIKWWHILDHDDRSDRNHILWEFEDKIGNWENNLTILTLIYFCFCQIKPQMLNLKTKNYFAFVKSKLSCALCTLACDIKLWTCKELKISNSNPTWNEK